MSDIERIKAILRRSHYDGMLTASIDELAALLAPAQSVQSLPADRDLREQDRTPEPSAEEARTTLVSMFRAFEAKRIPTTLPGCPDVLGYDDMADWFLTRFLAASPPPLSEDTQRDATRYRALRPFLSVGETEDGDWWGLWAGECVERTPAIYLHSPTEAEDELIDGDPEWGPGVDAMVDEMVAAQQATHTKEGA